MQEAVNLCFQGIQAVSHHEGTSMLKDAEVEATEEEWTRAELAIRQRRGARPPTAAVTVMVKPNQDLSQILRGLQTVGQDMRAVWVCRDEEQLNKGYHLPWSKILRQTTNGSQ